MKYRTWISEGDVVLAEPWDWQDEKANVEWRYEDEDADQLRARRATFSSRTVALDRCVRSARLAE